MVDTRSGSINIDKEMYEEGGDTNPARHQPSVQKEKTFALSPYQLNYNKRIN